MEGGWRGWELWGKRGGGLGRVDEVWTGSGFPRWQESRKIKINKGQKGKKAGTF